MKNILLLDAFHTGSHKSWANGLKNHSRHEIRILQLPGKNWKWRMHGAAVSFANQIRELNLSPDIILATDMLDLSTLVALTRQQLPATKFYLYFHENQINYPWSPDDQDIEHKRDYHYAFINYISAMAADKVFFNSNYHRNAFLEGAMETLSHFPDQKLTHTVEAIENKSDVLYLGLDLGSKTTSVKITEKNKKSPVILWNHRWEYDKNPNGFFKTMFRLNEENLEFKLNILGQSYANTPPIFEEAKHKLSHKILHFGYVNSAEAYVQKLIESDILPVTGYQDFFGGSVVEAIYHGCLPLLPNRLAYPEHIPAEFQEHFIYQDEKDLYSKLKNMIQDHDAFSALSSILKAHVAKYDWKHAIREYDEILDQ